VIPVLKGIGNCIPVVGINLNRRWWLWSLSRAPSDQATVPLAQARPFAGVKAWLEAAGITDRPIFRSIKKGASVTLERLSDRSVAQIMKARAEAAGFDPVLFSGHSLRAGFVTSACIMVPILGDGCHAAPGGQHVEDL
jgi:hypothetical protein